MHTLEKKQLNLLAHLAKVDGKFAKTEHELLVSFIKEKRLDPSILEAPLTQLKLDDMAHSENKVELLYWAIRMMHADGIIHDEEVRFCKHLAEQLGMREGLVDWAIGGTLPDWDTFRANASM